MSTDAYRAASKEAYEIVESVISGLVSEIEAGYVTDEEAAQETLHESCDSALIYTHTRYVCAWALPDSDEFDPTEEARNFDQMIAIKAYCNLRSAVEGRWSEVGEALKVAEDKRLEESGEVES